MKAKKKLMVWISKNDLAIPGTLRTIRLKCGKSGCICQSGNDSDKHGPYYLWDRKVNGKLTSTSIPKNKLLIFRRWIGNRERLEDIINQMKIESEEIARKSVTELR